MDDPKSHCLAGNSLLLTGLPGTGKTHLARTMWRGCESRAGMALWADLAAWFLLLGDFRQLPAVLDSWAGRPISAPLEHSQLIRDLAGGHRHELTENMRSDPGIFNS